MTAVETLASGDAGSRTRVRSGITEAYYLRSRCLGLTMAAPIDRSLIAIISVVSRYALMHSFTPDCL